MPNPLLIKDQFQVSVLYALGKKPTRMELRGTIVWFEFDEECRLIIDQLVYPGISIDAQTLINAIVATRKIIFLEKDKGQERRSS